MWAELDFRLWDIVLIATVIGVLIIIAIGFVGGFVGAFIAACTPNAPVWKGALVGIGVTAGAVIVVIAGIGLAMAMNFPPIPDGMWAVGWAGLATIAVGSAVVIIRRIGRNASRAV